MTDMPLEVVRLRELLQEVMAILRAEGGDAYLGAFEEALAVASGAAPNWTVVREEARAALRPLLHARHPFREFFVWRVNFEDRLRANEPFDAAMDALLDLLADPHVNRWRLSRP